MTVLLSQLLVILVVAQVMGLLFVRLRQPRVIGEIVAGILLGPSLLGWAWPGASAWLFPPGEPMRLLNGIAQLGVLMFLFLVGVEFNPAILKKHGRRAVTISVSGIALPFALGVGVTFLLLKLFDPEHQASPWPSALFMGAAMSVTAFPVLARIVAERNLHGTDAGGLAIAAAAVDDVLAWTLLAIVVAIVPSGEGGTLFGPVLKISAAAAFAVVMVFLIGPQLRRLSLGAENNGELTGTAMAVVFAILLGSALFTELSGVHALFGAFVAGVVMPKDNKFVHDLWTRIEPLTLTLLLPAFFAYAGLRVDLRTVLTTSVIGPTLLVIAIASLGKVVGCGGAALWGGLGARQSITIGLLMNTRGLMELIILSTGLSLGVINQTLYGMMVVMAVVTTAATAPLLSLLLPRTPDRRSADKIFSVLIPVGRPGSGSPLLNLAACLSAGEEETSHLSAVHLVAPDSGSLHRVFTGEVLQPVRERQLVPLLRQAQKRGIAVEPMAYFSRDVPSDIGRIVRRENIDLVLMGAHESAFGRSALGGVVHRVLVGVDADVGVFINRGVDQPARILTAFDGSPHSTLALELSARLARGRDATVAVLSSVEKLPVINGLEAAKIITTNEADFAREITGSAEAYDFVVIGVANNWGASANLLGRKAKTIVSRCRRSMLVVRKHTPA